MGKRIVPAFLVLILIVNLCACATVRDTASQIREIVSAATAKSKTEPQPDSAAGAEGLPQIITANNISAASVEQQQISAAQSEQLYCYATLNEMRKRIYRILLTAAENMTDGWIKINQCSSDYTADIVLAYKALTNDHPEFFWMPYSYLLNNAGSEKRPDVMLAFSYHGNGYNSDYLVSKERRDAMSDELEARINVILSKAASLSTAYEKEKFLHDSLCAAITYGDSDTDGLIYTAYGALIEGKAVCEGYSRAMQLLCTRLSIPCYLVAGEADGVGHMWNIVGLGDSWYHTDVTWDDNEANNYAYFNITDSEIFRDHTLAPQSTALSDKEIADGISCNQRIDTCNSTAENYFVKENMLFEADYATAVANAILRCAAAGLHSAQFRFTDQALCEAFSADYNQYIGAIAVNIARASGRNRPQIENISLSGCYVTIYWS